jgi:hypothetical protein
MALTITFHSTSLLPSLGLLWDIRIIPPHDNQERSFDYLSNLRLTWNYAALRGLKEGWNSWNGLGRTTTLSKIIVVYTMNRKTYTIHTLMFQTHTTCKRLISTYKYSQRTTSCDKLGSEWSQYRISTMSASITAIQSISFNYNVSTTQFVTVGCRSVFPHSLQSIAIHQSINQSVSHHKSARKNAGVKCTRPNVFAQISFLWPIAQ